MSEQRFLLRPLARGPPSTELCGVARCSHKSSKQASSPSGGGAFVVKPNQKEVLKMADKNVVTVEGNLTRDAVLIEKEGRVPVCLVRVACNRSRKNRRTGDWENHPRFFSVKVYGSRATEAAAFVKGQKVLVNGYLDSYTKGEGDGRHDVVSIVAGNAPDGITLVQKAGEQSQASAVSASDAEPTPAIKASSKSAGGSKASASSRTKTNTKGKSTKSKARS
jgi:single stranded DNA-binding protein